MALLNKNHIKSLVAVGTQKEDGSFVCDSTSFLVGFLVKDFVNPVERLYRTFLVTNRHVFNDRDSVSLRFNTDDGKKKSFNQSLKLPDGNLSWLAHPNPLVDLALLSINSDVLKKNNIQPIFITEEMFGYSKDFESINISVGDDVYAIGFPMGIAGEEQNYPCVKAGLISRIDKEIIESKKAFIIDSSIFPGNSGGPVILKPTIISLSDSKAAVKPFLIGVVSGYIPYSEQLFTHQTKPPTVVSLTRENSGLSFCVPIDFVKEIYDAWLEKNKPVEEPQKNNNSEDIKEEVKSKVE
jgi:S1-C subfamily serine protease